MTFKITHGNYDLSALEVSFKRDVLNKSMFTLLYFTLPYYNCC